MRLGEKMADWNHNRVGRVEDMGWFSCLGWVVVDFVASHLGRAKS